MSRPEGERMTTTGARRRPAPRDAWRAHAQSGVLFLLLVVSGALAWDAYEQHRSFDEHVRGSVQETAREAAGSLARLAQSYELSLVYRSIAPITGHLTDDTPDARARFFRMATHSATPSACADQMPSLPCEEGPARYVFHIDLRTGGWSATSDVAPVVRRWIRDSVTYEATHEYKPSWELAALDTSIAGEPHVVAYRVAFDAQGRAATANGMEIDTRRAAAQAFRRVFLLSPLLTSPITGGSPNDSLYVVEVRAADGALLFHGGTGPGGTEFVRVPAPRTWDFGAYAVRLALTPRFAGSLGNVVGHARTVATTYVLFGLSALLILFAIAQTRREQQLAQLREAFVGNVSHELRTPLAQIRIYAEALQFDYVRGAEARANALGVISGEAVRLTHLIENVLSYTKSSRAPLAISVRPVELAPVLDEVVRRFEPLALRAGVTVRFARDGATVVLGERGAIDQIVSNLLDNATRYAARGESVCVRVACAGDRVRILVEDRGAGIPPRDRERIWQRFVRLDAARDVPGAGIGLTVVAELTAAMGGRAWVEDAEPHGARFVVELRRGEPTV
jgi:signal transduction histidine kinase